MARSTLGLALLAAAFFFFLTVLALGAASTAMPDWVQHSDTNINEGLWSTCWGNNHCFPIGHYFLNCQSLLDTVRAFSIMTIIFAFLTLVAIFVLFFVDIEWFWILILVLALITMCVSVVPWTVYFAFVARDAGCVMASYGTKGAGWALAVAAFAVAAVGFLLVLLWVILGHPAAAPPVPPHMHIPGDRSRLGVALLGVAAILFLAMWVLSCAAAPATNWATLNVEGVHQGLWVTCVFDKCDNLVDGTDYTGQCLAFLNTVRAFNIMSIILGFIVMVLVLLMLFLEVSFLWIITLAIAILGVLISVIPWTVYALGTYGLGLFSNCVPGYLQPGGGWALAVASFVLGAVGLAFLIAWIILGERHGFHAPAARLCGKGGAKVEAGQYPLVMYPEGAVAAGGGVSPYLPAAAPTYTYAPAGYSALPAQTYEYAPAAAPAYAAPTYGAPTYGFAPTAAAPAYASTYSYSYPANPYVSATPGALAI